MGCPFSGCPVGEAAEAMARSDWKKMGARNEDEALGIFNSSCTGRVGDAAGAGSVMWVAVVGDCPPSGDRTARFSAMARRPRTRAAERLLAGPSRGRRCTPASYAGRARRRACDAVSGARRPRAGRYRPSRHTG